MLLLSTIALADSPLAVAEQIEVACASSPRPGVSWRRGSADAAEAERADSLIRAAAELVPGVPVPDPRDRPSFLDCKLQLSLGDQSLGVLHLIWQVQDGTVVGFQRGGLSPGWSSLGAEGAPLLEALAPLP